MQLTILTALHKAIDLVGTTIQKVTQLTKPQLKCFVWLIRRWWMLPVRYNFLSLSRYGGYSDRAIREQFAKPLPYIELFDALYRPLQQKECILAFDPTFVPRSGKQTGCTSSGMAVSSGQRKDWKQAYWPSLMWMTGWLIT